MQKMQKLFALIGMVVVGSLAVGVVKVLVGASWPDAPAKTSQAQAAGSSADQVSEREALIRGIIWIRATLPRRVDDRTTLVAVGLNGKTYWSHLVLDADAGEISGNTKEAMRRDAIADVCKRRSHRSATHVDDPIAVYHVEYVDRRRNPIQSIEITKNDCL